MAGLGVLIVLGAATPGRSQDNPSPVEMRQAGLKELGTAFKNLNDELKKPEPLRVMVKYAVATIGRDAAQLGGWFPPGSGPGPGVKTHAKPEIWTNRAVFDTLNANFRKASGDLAAANGTGDLGAVRTQAKTLGATCKACHEKFRVED